MLRLDVVNKETNLIESSIGMIKNGKKTIIDCPLNGKDIITETIQERLESVLYRCLNFTSKFIGVDELTGDKYPENEKNIYLYKLRGSNAISEHFCSGSVQYHKKNTHMLLWLEIMLWDDYRIIFEHNLKNKSVKIKRSNGDINDACIRNGCIRWSKTTNKFIIKVYFIEKNLKKQQDNLAKIANINSLIEQNESNLEVKNQLVVDRNNIIKENEFLESGEEMYKHVTLESLIEHNPDLDLTVIVPNIESDEVPEWVQFKYNNWIDFIKQNLIIPNNSILKIENLTNDDIDNYSDSE